MSLTVRELTQIPFLRTRFHAGAAGAQRVISWAHVTEMARPWEWLEKGDLLMTVGLGIPLTPAEQVTYVESLAAVEVSGLAIGEHMHAPPLSDAMLAAADRRALPILITAFEVPFIQISRTVAAANQGPEHLRLVKTVRIYDSVRAAAVRSSSPAELLTVLGDEIDCELFACTNDRAAGVFPDAGAPTDRVRDIFLAETARRGRDAMPGIARLHLEGATALVVPVPARRPVSLIAVPRASDAPPYAILQHVATVAALELERLTAAREEQRRLGSETLAGLLDARLSPHLAVPHLPAHGLGDEPMVMLVAQATGEQDSQLHHVLAERRIAHMMLRREPLLYFLTYARDEVVGEVADAIGGDGVRIGVSDAFSDLGTFPNAVREARWALEVAGTEQQRICRYGEQFGTLGPRSLAEARMIVDRVLGPVLAYDEHRGSELVQSLSVFLRCNRSWQQAADELFVHKQTLIYRMRRVEDLTGRRLGDTGTIAELWMAISALELLS